MIVNAFQQVQLSIDRELIIPIEPLFFFAVNCMKNDRIFFNRFNIRIGIQGYCSIQDGTTVKVSIGADISATAGKSDS